MCKALVKNIHIYIYFFFFENIMGGQWNFSIFVFDFALVCKILLSCSLGISTCGRRLARTGGEEDLGFRPRTALASAMVSSAADGPSELGRRCPS